MKRIGWLLVLAFNFSLFTFAQQGLDANGVRDLTLDSLDRANQVRPVSGSSRRGQNPVLFLVGNSTMRNGTLGNGNNGQWGWGYFCHEWFDEQRVTVENHALGGTSPRTFYRQLWPAVLKGVEAGDFVVLELGHNDNGPVDEGRARSSIQPALADDSLLVTIKETGRQEWVYTFGGYVRRFVNEIRAKGATPILLTLTPRNAYTDEAQTVIDRKLTTFTPWIRALASELHTPLIDLNDLSATKLERYGRWKADYHFFGDKIHSSAFGARMNAASFAEGLEQCNDPQVALLKQALLPEKLHPASLKGAGASGDSGNSGNSGKSETSVSAAPTKKKPKRPTVFLTGDSTVKNSDADPDGMWGWGAVAYEVFDSTKCTVINAAKAGRSTRTFLEEGRWDAVYNSIEPVATAADTCHVYHLQSNGQYRVVYSFGWYLKKFIGDVRERGGIPVLVSLTPRNEWPHGKIERRNDSYGRWYRQVAEETGVEFIDLHNLSADRMDKMGRERAAALFNHDHTHSSLAGARHTARCIAKGIKQQKSPLRHFLK